MPATHLMHFVGKKIIESPSKRRLFRSNRFNVDAFFGECSAEGDRKVQRVLTVTVNTDRVSL
jgi:hypothetical protein